MYKSHKLPIMNASVNAGGFRNLNSNPGRILTASFWCFAIAVIATYTGNLVAFLTVSKVAMPFDTLTGPYYSAPWYLYQCTDARP